MYVYVNIQSIQAYAGSSVFKFHIELASKEVIESYFSRIDIRDGKIDLPNFKKFISMLG